MTTLKATARLVASLGICIAIWVFAVLVNRPRTAPQYLALEQPWFAPSIPVFVTGWAIAFTLLGITLFILWQNHAKPGGRNALYLFITQLALMVLRVISYFFDFDVMSGLVISLVLLANGIASLFLIRRVSRVAVYVLLPYLIWIAYLVSVNITLVRLN